MIIHDNNICSVLFGTHPKCFFLLSAVWKMEIVLVNFLTAFNTHTILTDIILYQSQNTQLTVKQVDCLFLRRGRFKQL